MPAFSSLLRPALGLLLACAAGLALAQAKPRIDKAADLPRFSYRIDGKVEDVVRSGTRSSRRFAAALRRDTESVLAATRSPTRQRGATAPSRPARLSRRPLDDALQRIEADPRAAGKAGRQAAAAMQLRAMVAARKAPAARRRRLPRSGRRGDRAELATLPYATIENDIKSAKAGAETLGEDAGARRRARRAAAGGRQDRHAVVGPRARHRRCAIVLTVNAAAQETLIDTYGSLSGGAQGREGRHLGGARRGLPAGRALRAGADRRLGQRRRHGALPDQLVRDADGKLAFIAFDRYGEPPRASCADSRRVREVAADARATKGFSDLRSNVDSPEASEIKQLLSDADAGAIQGGDRGAPLRRQLRPTARMSRASRWRAIRTRGWSSRGSNSAQAAARSRARAGAGQKERAMRRPTSTS